MTQNQIPEGYCRCGCGQRTTQWKKTHKARGRIKGEYAAYVCGHKSNALRPSTRSANAAPETLMCSKCKQTLPTSDFHVSEGRYRSHCKSCISEAARIRYQTKYATKLKKRYKSDASFREKLKNRTKDRRFTDYFGGARDYVLRRDNYRCTQCGLSQQDHFKEYGLDIHIHHIDGSGESENPNNDPSNLITLCASCHGLVHTETK